MGAQVWTLIPQIGIFTWIFDSGKAIFRATSSRINTSGYRVLLNNDSSTSSCCREYVILSRLCLFVFSPISPKLEWHLFTNSLYVLKCQVRGNDGKEQHFHNNSLMYWSQWSVKLDTRMSIDGMSLKKIPNCNFKRFFGPVVGLRVFTWTLDSGKLIFRATSSRINTSGYRVLPNNDSSTSSCCRENVVLSRLCFLTEISEHIGN